MILGLDTATPGTTVAAWAPDGPAVERRDDPAPGQRPGHAARLLVLVEEVLAEAGGWERVERLAVGVGPGGFTGLRLGIATARALAQARDLPLVGVSSLRALAEGAGHAGVAGGADRAGMADGADRAGVAEGADRAGLAARSDRAGGGAGRAAGDRWPCDAAGRPVVAVIDARRGEVFAAAGDALAPAALAPAELAARIEPGSLAVGDGAVRFRAELERAGAAVPADGSPVHRVSALHVCRIAAAGEPADRDALLPDYRREPDASPPRLP